MYLRGMYALIVCMLLQTLFWVSEKRGFFFVISQRPLLIFEDKRQQDGLELIHSELQNMAQDPPPQNPSHHYVGPCANVVHSLHCG